MGDVGRGEMSFVSEAAKEGHVYALRSATIAADVDQHGGNILGVTVNGREVIPSGGNRAVSGITGDPTENTGSFLGLPASRWWLHKKFAAILPNLGRQVTTGGNVEQPGTIHGPLTTTYIWRELKTTAQSVLLTVNTIGSEYLRRLFNGHEYDIHRYVDINKGRYTAEALRVNNRQELPIASASEHELLLPMVEHMQLAIIPGQGAILKGIKRDDEGKVVGYEVIDVEKNIKHSDEQNDDRLDMAISSSELEIGDEIIILPDGINGNVVYVLHWNLETNMSQVPHSRTILFSKRENATTPANFLTVEKRVGAYDPEQEMHPGDFVDQTVTLEVVEKETYFAAKGITTANPQIEYKQLAA